MGEMADWINEQGELSDLLEGKREKTVTCWFCGYEWEVDEDVSLPLCPSCEQGEGED